MRGQPAGSDCTATLYFDAAGDAQELLIEGAACPQVAREWACHLLLDAEAAPNPGSPGRKLRLHFKNY